MKKALSKKEQTKLNNDLFEAIKFGKDTDDVIALLEQIPKIDIQDELGRTPLHWAALCNNVHLAKLLLAKGAKINIQDDKGCTALYYAVMWGHKEIVELLLENEANPNIENNKKETALHGLLDPDIRDAIEIEPTNEYEIVKLLVDKRADLNKLDKKGNPPLFYAALKDERTEILQVLIEQGAKFDEILFEKLNRERPLITSEINDLLKSAIITSKLFEKDEIKNISEDLKNHLQKEIKFTIDSMNNQTKIIEFSHDSYKKTFQSLLTLELKNAIAKGAKDTTNLLKIVDNNIQEIKLLTEINFEEIYQNSILNLHELCINGDYSILSLQGIVTIDILKLLSEGKLTEEQTAQTLSSDSFNKLVMPRDIQTNNYTSGVATSAAGQTNLEVTD